MTKTEEQHRGGDINGTKMKREPISDRYNRRLLAMKHKICGADGIVPAPHNVHHYPEGHPREGEVMDYNVPEPGFGQIVNIDGRYVRWGDVHGG